jgi:Trm5-related predicted tRNA methylase
MNDVQWVEAARALAQIVIREAGPDTQHRINRMSEILLAHDAPAPMEAALEASVKQMQDHYAKDPKAARSLVEIGEKRRDASIPEPELATWTMVASEMLNLDETINK